MEGLMADIALLAAKVAGPVAARSAAGGLRWATFTLRAAWIARSESRRRRLPVPRLWRLRRFLGAADVVNVFASGSSERLKDLESLVTKAPLAPGWQVDAPTAKDLVAVLLGAVTRALPPNQAIEAQVRTATALVQETVREERAAYGDVGFELSLRVVPPLSAETARELSTSWPDVRRLTSELAASGDRKQLIRDWVGNRPNWLQDAPAPALIWMSALAEAHGLLGEAVTLIDEALTAGASPAAYWRLRRAFLQIAKDAAVQKATLTALTAHHPLREALHSFLDEDPGKAIVLLEAWRPANPYERHFQQFLLAQFQAAAGNLDEALKVARSELDAGHTAASQFVADRLLAQAIDRTSANHFAQLASAFDLAIATRNANRDWSGPSVAAVETAIRAAEALGDGQRAWALTQISGEATETESSHPSVRDRAVLIAAETQPIAAAGELVRAAPDSLRRAQALALLAEREDDAEKAQECWLAAMEKASEPEDLLRIGFQLARHGTRSPRLDELRKRHPREVEELQLVADLNSGATGALERIRGGARRNRHLTFGLITYLQNRNDLDQAAQAAEDGASRWADAELWLTAARLWDGAQEYARAESAARNAIREARAEWDEALQAHLLLITSLSAQNKWSEATDAAATAMVRYPRNASAVWGLVLCQVQLGKLEDAWKTYAVFGGRPAARNPREVCVLIRLLQKFDPTEQSLDVILTSQRAWADYEDVKVVTAHALMFFPAGELSENADRKLKERVAELVSDLPHVFVPKTFDEDDPRASLNAMVADLPDTSELERQVSDGTLPFGMAASLAHRSFVETLAIRQGPLHAHNATTFAYEIAAAASARTAAVVIDGSAVMTLSYFEDDIAEQMLGFAASISAPLAHLIDANRARESLAGLSTMTVSRNPDGTARVSSISDEEAQARFDRAGKAAMRLDEIRCVERTWPARIPELGDHLDSFTWLESLDLALDESPQALWCDDARVRQLARGLAVSSFSTSGLIEAMRRERLFENDVAAHLQAVLIQRQLVGGAFDPQLAVTAANLDGWAPRGVAAHLAWAPLDATPEVLIPFAFVAIKHNLQDPEAIQGWTEAIAHWLVRTGGEHGAEKNLVILLRGALLEDWLTPATLPFVLAGIRTITELHSLEDPFEPAITLHYDQLTSLVEPRIASAALRALVSLSPDRDRTAALRIVLAV
jgi:hypothetical protein